MRKIENPLVSNCLALIELMATEARRLRLSEIASRLGLSKGSTHKLLTILREEDWVEQDDRSDLYSLNLRLAGLGQCLLVGTQLSEVCQPVLERLAQDSQELVRLAISGSQGLTWISFAQGSKSSVVCQPRHLAKVPLHVTAAGKAWLATLDPDEAVKIVLRDGLGRPGEHGPRAIKTIEQLLNELQTTRQRGYAYSSEESEEGAAAVAAAIRPGSGKVVGTVSVTWPVFRTSDEKVKKLAEAVQKTALSLAAIWPLRQTIEKEFV